MTEAVKVPEGVETFGVGHRIEGRVEVVRVSDLPAILQHALAVERERWEKETRERLYSQTIVDAVLRRITGGIAENTFNASLATQEKLVRSQLDLIADAIFDKGEGDG